MYQSAEAFTILHYLQFNYIFLKIGTLLDLEHMLVRTTLWLVVN